MGSRPRSPGVVYGVVTLVLLVLMAILTMSQRQPPPPTISEFAPQAVETITDTQTDQASRAGRAGSGVEGDIAPLPTPAPAAIAVPRVRRCVGDPPRQIEDPQSPPCVPYWSGDNGGATWRGVTRDEIRVADPNSNWVLSAGLGGGAYFQMMAAFFNRRFEFYGRTLRLIALQQAETGGPVNGEAAATEADDRHKVFASASTRGDNVSYYSRWPSGASCR